MLFSGGGARVGVEGGRGGGGGPSTIRIPGTPMPSATRGDQGAKALRNPLVTTHAEIPSASSGVGGYLGVIYWKLKIVQAEPINDH